MKIFTFLRLFWMIIFVISSYGAFILTANSWQRYNANPTVIAIEKDYRKWNITFPSATFCMLDSLDEKKAATYITQKWGLVGKVNSDEDDDRIIGANEENEVEGNNINSAEEVKPEEKEEKEKEKEEDKEAESKNNEFAFYLEFLRTLVNATYDNLHKFRKYRHNETLANLQVESVIKEVLYTINQQSAFFDKDFSDTNFRLVPTELGFCYSHGNVLTDYIPSNFSQSKRTNFQPPVCNFANYVCYARTEGLPRAIRYYVHSPYEIPDSASRWFSVQGRTDSDTTFTYLETISSSELERLTAIQRRCRFLFEPSAPHLPVYSFNLCRMQCRKELAFQLCGCAPHFYSKQPGVPVCDISGLICLSFYSELLITLKKSDGTKIPCNCFPQCVDITYVKYQENVNQWTFPVPYDVRFRWSIEKFSRMRIKRDVIYSFEDLLVSVGGTASLFLGCSVISFVEIVYFLTVRLGWFFIKLLQ